MDSEVGDEAVAPRVGPPIGPPKGLSGFIPRPPPDARAARLPPQGPEHGAARGGGGEAPGGVVLTGSAAPAVEAAMEAEGAVPAREEEAVDAEPPEAERTEEDSAIEEAIASMRAEREGHASREMAGLRRWLSSGRLDLGAVPAMTDEE